MLLVWAPDVEDHCPVVCSAAFHWRDRRKHNIPHFLLLPRPSCWATLHSLAVSLLWLWLSPGCVHCLDLAFIRWPRDWPKSPGLQNQNWEMWMGPRYLHLTKCPGDSDPYWVWEIQDWYPQTPPAPTLQDSRLPPWEVPKLPLRLGAAF